jgi:nanoRNase/pAp phosphatase (c-di-AMP/oligoRNAs hydrolase)
MMAKVCLYHGDDLDGICSAAIIKYRYPETKLYPVNYGVNLSPKKDFNIKDNDYVFIVDFTLRPFSDMKMLNDITNLVWIDHHDTSINQYVDYRKNGGDKIDGIRNRQKAACELVWEYIFPTQKVPYSVWLLGRFDVWKHDESESIVPFQYGMMLDHEPPENIDFWKTIFTEHRDNEFIQNIIKNGKVIIKYRSKLNKRICESQAFESYLLGYKCICINRALCGSTVFDSVWNPDKYDIMVVFYICSKGFWNVSLYTNKPNINVGEIAKLYGGGGHVSAAGFKCCLLPFEID